MTQGLELRISSLFTKDRKPATEAEILSAAGKITSARRKTRKGGRPKVMRKCPICKVKLSAREMMAHTHQVATKG